MKLPTDYTTTVGRVIAHHPGKLSLSLKGPGEFAHFYFRADTFNLDVTLGDIVVVEYRRNPFAQDYAEIRSLFHLPYMN